MDMVVCFFPSSEKKKKKATLRIAEAFYIVQIFTDIDTVEKNIDNKGKMHIFLWIKMG